MSTPASGLSIAQQMLQDGSLPDMPDNAQRGGGVPMRAVVAAAATTNPDQEARTQQLAQRAGMPVDLTRSNPQYAQQRALGADLDRRQLEITNPILARQLQDPSFAGVAHDDLDSLSGIEQAAAVARRSRIATETGSFAGNINRSFFGAFKPLVDAVGGGAEDLAASPKPLMDALTGLDPNFEELKNVWINPRRIKTQQATQAALDWVSQGIQPGQQQYVQDPNTGGLIKNPDYRWYGRPLVNSLEQVPGALAAFALTGKLGGATADAGATADTEGITGAVTPGAAVESQTVPALLGTQAAQETYAQARAKGVDQKSAVLAALAAGMTNYGLMGKMPAPVSPSSVGGAIGQWAGRSVGMGAAMTAVDNSIARSYDPDRGAWEGLPQSIATMAAFEGVGALGHIADAVEASKLRKRSPEVFEQFANAATEGDQSVRVPAQDFVNYFAEKKIDPAVMANRLGVTNLDEAIGAGSDLEIPLGNWIGRLDPEHQKGLLPDVVDPATDMTSRQAVAGKQELQEWVSSGGVEKLAAEYAQADAETQATPEWKEVYSDLKQRYVDAGEADQTAENYATLQANAITSLAKRAGLKPDELLALHNPKVVAGTAPAESAALPEETAILNQGPNFGPVHDEFYHDAQGAIEKLLAEKDGEATAALHYPSIGDIDLAYGKEGTPEQDYEDGYGLAKIAAKHPEVLDDLQGFLSGLKVVERTPNRVRLADEDGHAVVSLNWFEKPKKWLLTAYREGKEEVPAAEGGSMGVTPNAEPAHPVGQEAGSESVPEVSAGNKGETLYQAQKGDGSGPRKERNLEAARIQGEMLTGQPRGWFRMLPDGRYEIGKTSIGDLSTFIHEPAHAYLEMFRELTQREGASEPLKDDFKKITEWLGTTPEEAYKNGFTREQHEQWARANEQYVRDGQAPTSGLRRAFHNFSVWMSSIYRRASALGVELSPEIRGVMDRLYAGDNAVDRAERDAPQQLFETPENAGWTEEQYRNYAEAKGLEIGAAREQVRRELNDAAVRDRTQAWREEKSNVRDAVTEEIDKRPEYAAIRSLRRGKTDLGTDLSLNRDALIGQFGEERVKALQQLHRGLYRMEGGTDAETAAELLGFGSGEEMMRALENAPRRAAAIESAVRDFMTAKHGDIRYDGSLDDKARLAMENGERAQNLHKELAALRAKVAGLEKKAADTKAAMASIAIAPLEHYQEAARQMVDNKAIADLQPYRYLNASRKFSREAFDALRKGNVQAAADAKNKELLNHFLFREASAARDYADKFESYAKRMQTKGVQQRLGLADQNARKSGYVGDYQAQFNWLFARYRLGGLNAVRPERSLSDWAKDMYDQDVEPAIPPSILNESRAADYRNVPLSEVHDLHDALINIRHLAKMEYEALINGKRLQLEQMAKELDEGIRANMKVTPEKVFEDKPGFLRGFAHSIDVQNSRMEFLVNKWDGGERGPWREYVWEPYQNAKGDELSMQHEFTQAMSDVVEREAKRQGLRLTEKVMVDGIPAEESLTRKEFVSIALNMGNSSNLDRLQKTFDRHGWDREAIRRIGGALRPEEWQFVQGVWDALKPWGERMKQLEQRLTGVAPAMVQVEPFKVVRDDGTEMELAGGYYPVHYDPRYADKGFDEEASLTSRNLMEKGYGRATTSRNYTKERTGFGGPLLFDYERTLTGHIAKVTKDISHREFMLLGNRLLLHPRVRQALRETQGSGADQDAMAWVRSTVNDRNGSIDGGPNDIRPYLMKIRSNLVRANLVWKASTMALQFGHLPRLMEFTSPKSYAQAMAKFWANPVKMTQTIRDLSPNQMRFRGENLDRDYAAMLREIAGKGSGISKAWQRISSAPLMYIDHAVSFPLWLSVYNDALLRNGPEMEEGESRKIAMHAADSAVQMGLGTGTTGDLPPIMRSPDLFKQYETTLFGFENLNYNIVRHKVAGDAARAARGGNYLTAAQRLTYGLAMTFFVPAIVSAYTRGNGPKDGENWGEWAAERALFFGAGTIPIVKDAAALWEYGSDRSLNPVSGMLGKVIDDLKKSGREGETDWGAFGIDALETIGDLFGVSGTAQAAHTARYAYRASQGKIENPSAYGAIVGGR